VPSCVTGARAARRDNTERLNEAGRAWAMTTAATDAEESHVDDVACAAIDAHSPRASASTRPCIRFATGILKSVSDLRESSDLLIANFLLKRARCRSSGDNWERYINGEPLPPYTSSEYAVTYRNVTFRYVMFRTLSLSNKNGSQYHSGHVNLALLAQLVRASC
jgi:hypothetical protein